MIRRRTAYARTARIVARGLEASRLTLAVNLRSPDLATQAVDWDAFRAALEAAGFPGPQAARLAGQARLGLAVMVKAGTLSAEEVGRLFGLTSPQAANALRLKSYLDRAEISERQVATVLAQRRDSLIGRQLDPIARPLQIGSGRKDYLRIDKVAESLESRAEGALRAAMKTIKARVDDEVVAALRAGDDARVIKLLTRKDASLSGLEATLRAGLSRSGKLAMESVGRQVKADGLFSATAPGVEEWITRRVGELERWLDDSTRRSAAEILAGSKDLSAEERAALLRQRLDLAPSTISGLLGRDAPAADVFVARADRFEAFAAAQTYAAVQEGQRLAWKQAEDSGLTKRGAERIWATRDNGAECERCGPMHGQRRGIGEPFESLGAPGMRFMNPGDPHAGWRNPCYCAVLILAEAA